MHKFLFVLVALMVAVYARPDEKYTTRWDSIDLHAILSNKRLLLGYIKCLLDEGPCSPDGTELKRVLPDAIEDGCSKCSEKQKEGAKEVLRHLLDHDRENWDKLEKKYDPTGAYRKKYEGKAKTEGFNI